MRPSQALGRGAQHRVRGEIARSGYSSPAAAICQGVARFHHAFRRGLSSFRAHRHCRQPRIAGASEPVRSWALRRDHSRIAACPYQATDQTGRLDPRRRIATPGARRDSSHMCGCTARPVRLGSRHPARPVKPGRDLLPRARDAILTCA
jgi:hypothetical protein